MCGHAEHKRRPRKKPEQLKVPYSDKGQKHTLGKKTKNKTSLFNEECWGNDSHR